MANERMNQYESSQGTQGINLILNSNFANGTSKWRDWGAPPTREIVEQNGKHWVHIVSDGQPYEGYQQNRFKDGITITGGQKYTFSARMKGGSANQKISVGIHWLKDGIGGQDNLLGQKWHIFTVGTDEQLVSITWTAHADANSFNIMIGSPSGVTDAYFTDIKLEPGEVSDPTWTPAPQDISYTPHQQYYLSTSATTQTGGSWSETQPTWESGKYLWERLRLVWSDGRADTFTTPQRALALEQALQAAKDAHIFDDSGDVRLTTEQLTKLGAALQPYITV